MNELKISAFKKNLSSNQEYDLDFSKEDKNDEISSQEKESSSLPEPEEPINTDEKSKKEDDSQESKKLLQNDDINKNSEEKNNSQSNSSLTPNSSEPKNGTQLELTDDIALNYLSEKLGKKIKSFEDFKQTSKIENPLDSDPYLKKLHEWRKQTGRPIEDWIKYQKDYSSLSDIDVAREFLLHEYPNLTRDEIDLELKKYLISEYDSEDEAALKNLELKKYSARGRNTLGKLVSELGEPTKAGFSPEIQEDLNIAKQYKEAVAQQKQFQDEYNKEILSKSLSTENYELNLNDDLKIQFKLSENSRKELPKLIETMPHWRNKDGSWNHQAVVNDAIKINNFDEMIKLAYEQGLNAGKESIIADTKNSTLGQPSPQDANLQNGNKGVVIEGFDDFIGNKGMKVRFKK